MAHNVVRGYSKPGFTWWGLTLQNLPVCCTTPIKIQGRGCPSALPCQRKVPQGKETQSRIQNVRFSASANQKLHRNGWFLDEGQGSSVQLQWEDSTTSQERRRVQAPQSSPLHSGGLTQRPPLLHHCYYKLKQSAKNISVPGRLFLLF